MKLVKSIKNTFMWSQLFLMQLAISADEATGGLGNVNKFMTSLAGALRALSVATCVVAILIVGFKVLFNGDHLRDCKGWIAGGALIAGSSEIAKMLLT